MPEMQDQTELTPSEIDDLMTQSTLDQILTNAWGARQNSQQLLPLLNLLDETPGETSPLDELKGLLQAIIEILGHHTAALQRLESACASGSLRNN